MPVVVGARAAADVRHAAEELAQLLSRITGATFSVQVGDGRTGIAVGVVADFPALGLDERFSKDELVRREQYVLRWHPGGVFVVAAALMGVEDAVWGLAYRLGYRQFFPGATWEIVPHEPKLGVAVDALEQPDFLTRQIFVGFGMWDHDRDAFADWRKKNRIPGAFSLSTGHAFKAFVQRHTQELKEHPEYLALVDGERKGKKLCLTNPGLRALFVKDALDLIRGNPHLDSVSAEPSDGLGWCTCDTCVGFGSPSDRVLLLANDVADAVRAQYPLKRVAFYAYADHSRRLPGYARTAASSSASPRATATATASRRPSPAGAMPASRTSGSATTSA